MAVFGACMGVRDLPSPCLCSSTVSVLRSRCSAALTASPPMHAPLCSQPGLSKKQAGLHGNGETAEKWQLNAAAPHLISTLALTEQIMGNNTPLCCGEMKCFSRRLSCCRDLFVTVPPEISLPFCLSLSVISSSFSPSSFPFLPVSALVPSLLSAISVFSFFLGFLLSPLLFSLTSSVVFSNSLMLHWISCSWCWSVLCPKPKSSVKLQAFCSFQTFHFLSSLNLLLSSVCVHMSTRV